jgi:hypothetical protein
MLNTSNTYQNTTKNVFHTGKFRPQDTPAIQKLYTAMTDSFTRSAEKTAAPTYPAPQKTAQTKGPDVITIEGRQAAAKDYDAILTDLRKQYGEAEAMRRFDAIMRADGFELVETTGSGPQMAGGHTSSVTGLAQQPTSIYGNSDKELTYAMREGNEGIAGKNIVLQSNMYGTHHNGNAEVATESWAIFSPDRPYSKELQDYWQNRHLDAVREEADFDADAYMAGLSNASQRSAVDVDTDTGSLVARILTENGIELGEGASIDLGLNDRGEITVGGTGVEDPYALFTALNASPELKSAMRNHMTTPPMENVSELPGAYADGERSVEYSTQRQVTYSASAPSSVVVNDYLGVTGKGYTYAKKAGDYFDPDANSSNISSQVPITERLANGADSYAAQVVASDQAVNDKLAEAVATGKPVYGTIAKDTADQVKRNSFAEYAASLAGIPRYDAVEEWDKASLPTANAATPPAAAPEKSVEPAPAPSPKKAAQENSQTAIASIVSRLRAQQAAIGASSIFSRNLFL